ncbi:unnamed protein product [Ambrosiozyma monospora]|uniref:Unnamed protein product n=1 Tax=Ambrosiozyma monospora TaxID=43982 RepID=A0A9W6YV42_AMBMO|nr:unnamed protein product [Ambrosiozyma monospora]
MTNSTTSPVNNNNNSTVEVTNDLGKGEKPEASSKEQNDTNDKDDSSSPGNSSAGKMDSLGGDEDIQETGSRQLAIPSHGHGKVKAKGKGHDLSKAKANAGYDYQDDVHKLKSCKQPKDEDVEMIDTYSPAGKDTKDKLSFKFALEFIKIEDESVDSVMASFKHAMHNYQKPIKYDNTSDDRVSTKELANRVRDALTGYNPALMYIVNKSIVSRDGRDYKDFPKEDLEVDLATFMDYNPDIVALFFLKLDRKVCNYLSIEFGFRQAIDENISTKRSRYRTTNQLLEVMRGSKLL